MPLWKVHELTFLWFGLPGPLLRQWWIPKSGEKRVREAFRCKNDGTFWRLLLAGPEGHFGASPNYFWICHFPALSQSLRIAMQVAVDETLLKTLRMQFLLTIGSFLLALELVCLELCLGAFLDLQLELSKKQLKRFLLTVGQRVWADQQTVSKKARLQTKTPNVSKKLPPCSFNQNLAWKCLQRRGGDNEFLCVWKWPCRTQRSS